MITFLFGLPGSGKSYKAVGIILEYLEQNKPVYSNIEFKVSFSGYFFLDTSALKKWLDDVFSVLEKEGEEVEYYVKELSKYVQKGALYVIDECHFYGLNDRKKSEYWRLLLSIHRHLHIDFLFITQTYRNINSSLLDLGEIFVKAIPPTSRLVPNRLEYVQYASFDGYKRGDKLSIVKREVVKSDKKIFDIYSSGAKNLGFSGLRNKVYTYILGSLVLVVYVFYSLYGLINSTPQNSIKRSEKNVTVVKKNVQKKEQKNVYKNYDNCELIQKKMTPSAYSRFVSSYQHHYFAIFDKKKKYIRVISCF